MTKYAAQLAFDYSGHTDNTKAKLLRSGLEQIGWKKIGTTSYQIQTSEIDDIWRGLLCMIALDPTIGELGSLAVQVSKISPVVKPLTRNGDTLLKIKEHKLPEIQNLPRGFSSR